MIARIWAGATRAADGDAYLDYLHATGFPEYRATPGNRGVLALRRVVGDRAEFVLLSLWDSEEAIRRFAGDDIEQAVFYPEDERVLIDRGERVRHYEVAYQAEEVAP
jgi:heme-degrading monooxygenase HmoA